MKQFDLIILFPGEDGKVVEASAMVFAESSGEAIDQVSERYQNAIGVMIDEG